MLEKDITYKKIWNIAYPIILGSVVQNIISVTDTAFLGHVGEVELGGAAIGGVFYLILVMLGMGFSIGTQIIVARRYGEDKIGEIGKIIEHGLYFLLIFGIILILSLRTNIGGLLKVALQSSNIYEASHEYLRFRILGLVFAFVNFGFRAFYIGIAKTQVITWTTVFMAVMNIFFDYSLIFGHFGFEAYGIKGAAIASVIAEGSATIFFIFYTLVWTSYKKYNLFRFHKVEFVLFKRIFTVAFPMMMQYMVSFIGWFFFFLFVEKMGEHDLAISNIIRSAYVIMLIPTWGYSSATNTLVSYTIGKGYPDEVLKVIGKILKITFASVAVIVAISVSIPEHILSIYTNDKQMIADCLPVFYVVSVCAFALASGFVLFNGVAGTGNTKMAFYMEVVTIMIYIGVTYLYTHILETSINVVWSVEMVYGLSIGIISYIYLKKGKWAEKKI